MSYAQNKSLIEYGDLNSIHHVDRQAEQEAGQAELDRQNKPAYLLVDQSVGGSYHVKWSKGDAEVPFECLGLFTGPTQAQAAIKQATIRMAAEKEEANTQKVEDAFAEAAQKTEPTAQKTTRGRKKTT